MRRRVVAFKRGPRKTARINAAKTGCLMHDDAHLQKSRTPTSAKDYRHSQESHAQKSSAPPAH